MRLVPPHYRSLRKAATISSPLRNVIVEPSGLYARAAATVPLRMHAANANETSETQQQQVQQQQQRVPHAT
jgi:hypothetical protein